MKKFLCLFTLVMAIMVTVTPLWASSYTLGTYAVCTGLVPDGTIQYKNIPTGVGTTFNVGDTVYFFTELKDINSNFRMGIKVYKEGVEIWKEFNSNWNNVGNGWKYSYYYPSQLNSVAGDYSAETYIDTGNGWQLLNTMNYSVGNAPVPTPTPTEKIVIPYLINDGFGWTNKLVIRNLKNESTEFFLDLFNNGQLESSISYSLDGYEYREVIIAGNYNYGEILYPDNSIINGTLLYYSDNKTTSLELSNNNIVEHELYAPFNNLIITDWKLILISNSEDEDEDVSLLYIKTTGETSVGTTIMVPSHSNIIDLVSEDCIGIIIQGAEEKNIQTVSLFGNSDLTWIRMIKGLLVNP